MFLTRKRKLEQTDQLERLSRESGKLWTEIVKWYWRMVRRQDHWTDKSDMQKWKVNGHDSFHAHTAQAVNDQFYDALNTWFNRKV